MLKELFELVKGTATDSVISNPAIPDEKNDEVVAEATNTVASGLRNMVAGGGVQSLMSLFGNDGKSKQGLLSNPLVSMMIGHFAGKLISRHNINGAQASSIAGNLIPGILGNLISKSNDPNDQGFSLDNLLNSITGGKSAEVAQEKSSNGIQDILGQLMGGEQGNNNNGGLMDIIGKLAGGAQEQQQRNGGGGLMDLIKGFIK